MVLPVAVLLGRRAFLSTVFMVDGVGHSPEPFLDDRLREWLDFAEPDGAEAGGLGGEGEASNAGKQVKVSWFIQAMTG